MANWPPKTQEDLDAMANSQALQPVTPTSLNPISMILEDVINTAAPKDGPLAAMVWGGKKTGPGQMVKFLKTLAEHYNRTPEGLKAKLPDIAAANAFWGTRRTPTAETISKILPVELPEPGLYGQFHPNDWASALKALGETAGKRGTKNIKSGSIVINPKENDSILEAIDTLTHEGQHGIQFRKSGYTVPSTKEEAETLMPEPPAYAAGRRGKIDFADFMTELLNRRSSQEPILKRAMENDPALLSVIDALEKRTSAAMSGLSGTMKKTLGLE